MSLRKLILGFTAVSLLACSQNNVGSRSKKDNIEVSSDVSVIDDSYDAFSSDIFGDNDVRLVPSHCVDDDEDGFFDVCNPPYDCDDKNNLIFPGGLELCDYVDNDCDGDTDEDVAIKFYLDFDKDGKGASQFKLECTAPEGYVLNSYDCDDNNDLVYLGANELCDAIDNNCNNLIDEGYNLGKICNVGVGACENSGKLVCSEDGKYSICDVVPIEAIMELCDYVDNDCDGSIDEEFVLDGECSVGVGECFTIGKYICNDVGDGTVCGVDDIEPGFEVCDFKDNDCDGFIDEGLTLVQSCGNWDVGECSTGVEYNFCVDGNYAGWQGCSAVVATLEVCDGLDNDCNSVVDDGLTIVVPCGESEVGECSFGIAESYCLDGKYTELSACSDVGPLQEECDGKDNDCDGLIDEGLDLIQICGESNIGECTTSEEYKNCVDGSYVGWEGCLAVFPSTEVCDNKDNDCNGIVDDGLKIEFYLDNDKDGFGSLSSIKACQKPEGYVKNKDDCDDLNKEINPIALEKCDYVDNDCDGSIDEDVSCVEIIDDFNRPSGNLGNNLFGNLWSNYGSLGDWVISEDKYGYNEWTGKAGSNPSASSEIGYRETFNMLVKFKLSAVNSVGGGGAFIFVVNATGGSIEKNLDGLGVHIAQANASTHTIGKEKSYMAYGNQTLEANKFYLMRFSFDGSELGLKIWKENQQEPIDYMISTELTNVDSSRKFITLYGDMDGGESGATTIDYIIDEKF